MDVVVVMVSYFFAVFCYIV